MPERTDRALMVTAAWPPRQSAEAVGAAPDRDLRVADDCSETPMPTAEELEIVRACDSAGFWTR